MFKARIVKRIRKLNQKSNVQNKDGGKNKDSQYVLLSNQEENWQMKQLQMYQMHFQSSTRISKPSLKH